MACSPYRELVSAALDGELAEDERRLLDRHLEGCGSCRLHRARATELHRSLRVQPAPPVPDLTEAVLIRLDRAQDGVARPRRRSDAGWRVGLAVVGLAQLVLSGPALVLHRDGNAELQAMHHLNAWAVAFAVGLLVVAWQPWRVRGVLPIATTLAAVMLFTVALDMVNDHRIGMPATAHVLEVAGLVLTWGLARHGRRAGGGPGDGGRMHPAGPVIPALTNLLRSHGFGRWARLIPGSRPTTAPVPAAASRTPTPGTGAERAA